MKDVRSIRIAIMAMSTGERSVPSRESDSFTAVGVIRAVQSALCVEKAIAFAAPYVETVCDLYISFCVRIDYASTQIFWVSYNIYLLCVFITPRDFLGSVSQVLIYLIILP